MTKTLARLSIYLVIVSGLLNAALAKAILLHETQQERLPNTEKPSLDHPIQEEQIDSQSIQKLYKEQELVRKKGGGYLGVGFGFPLLRVLTNNKNLQKAPTPYTPVVFSLKTGIQSFFTKNVGIRGFFSLDTYTDILSFEGKKSAYQSLFIMPGVGLDAIVEFPLGRKNSHFLGFYAGGGVAGQIYIDNQNYSSVKNLYLTGGFTVEGGIELTLFIRHRLSFRMKVTPIQRNRMAPFLEQTEILTTALYSYLF